MKDQILDENVFCTFCSTNVNNDEYESHLKICFQERNCEVCKEPFPNHNFNQVYTDHFYMKHTVRDFKKLKSDKNINIDLFFTNSEYDKYFDSLKNENTIELTQCKLCDNIVYNSFHHRKNHIIMFHRGPYFPEHYLLFENNFSTNLKENYCVCKICGLFFEDVLIFLYNHCNNIHSLNFHNGINLYPKVFCNLCNEETSIQTHQHLSFLSVVKKKLPILKELNFHKELNQKNIALQTEYLNNNISKSKSFNPNHISEIKDEMNEASLSKLNSTSEKKPSIIDYDDYMEDYEIPALIKSLSKEDPDVQMYNNEKDKIKYIKPDDYISSNHNITSNNKLTNQIISNFNNKEEVLTTFTETDKQVKIWIDLDEKILGGKKIFGNYINPMTIKLNDLVFEFDKLSTKNKVLSDPYINDKCKKNFEPLKLIYVDILGKTNHFFKFEKPNTSESLKEKIKIQLEIFQNSFPCDYYESYFLRVDKNYFQFMKLLIAGERGTPFEHGLYEFDIFIPESYPISKPYVACLTSFRSNFTFCPSLYKNGRVHYDHPVNNLNILFPESIKPFNKYGRDFSENEFTLMKCFIQIQNTVLGEMILDTTDEINKKFYFITEVYENEGYCNIIRYLNIKVAMIIPCRDAPEIFKDVIDVYFKTKRNELLEDINFWIKRAKNTGYCFDSYLIKKYNENLMLKFYKSEDVYIEELQKLFLELESLI